MIIFYEYNDNIITSEALRCLNAFPDLRNTFEEYFNDGVIITQDFQ